MSNTYTQIHIHAIFAVQNRISLLHPSWETRLHQYITGIIRKNDHKLLAINGNNDHVHILFGMRPVQSLSDLMKDIKGFSSHWINENHFVAGRFSWQEGYGAFSYSKSQLPSVINYIANQKAHHQTHTFIDEYIRFLNEFGIEFDSKYIFKPIE
jgi:REP element-mobilizing transposase RayT